MKAPSPGRFGGSALGYSALLYHDIAPEPAERPEIPEPEPLTQDQECKDIPVNGRSNCWSQLLIKLMRAVGILSILAAGARFLSSPLLQ